MNFLVNPNGYQTLTSTFNASSEGGLFPIEVCPDDTCYIPKCTCYSYGACRFAPLPT